MFGNQIEIVELVTPRNYLMNGIYMGPKKPDRVFVYVHGLNSNLFSGDKIFSLANRQTGVLTFNNRSHDVVSRIKKLNPVNQKGYDSEFVGTAHEKFEDCVDDLEGVVEFCHKRGAAEIYLVGHSTGCQKSIYYLHQTSNKQNVTGVVLLCPLSDYAAVAPLSDKACYEKVLEFSRSEVREGRPHTLLSEEYWPRELIDAQRFLSLYTPESPEEIFTYSHDKKPTSFASIKIPMLVVLAGSDEYADRSSEKLRVWFDKNHKSSNYKSVVIENAPHNLKGSEAVVCQEINNWSQK